MYGVWTVFRLEVRLLARSRGIWLALLATAFFGVWEVSAVREEPFGAWSQFVITAMFVTMILALSTGGQVSRDRDRRVDGVLLSTPLGTSAYVCGKYLGALAVALGLAIVMLGSAIGMDHVDNWKDPPAVLGHSRYPALGPWPYVSAWLWLVVVPVVFGTALALAAVTLTGGKRVVGSMLVVFLWLGPVMLGSATSSSWANLLDVPTLSYSKLNNAPTLPPDLYQIFYTGQSPTPELAAKAVQFMVAHLPPELPAVFYWNRALFAMLAVVLVAITVYRVRGFRRGR